MVFIVMVTSQQKESIWYIIVHIQFFKFKTFKFDIENVLQKKRHLLNYSYIKLNKKKSLSKIIFCIIEIIQIILSYPNEKYFTF